MAYIFVIRHGDTEGNEKKIYRGRWDLPLNGDGLMQAKRAGEALKTVKLSAIYTSPLERARQTALAIADKQNGAEPVVEEALIDIDYGDWSRIAESEVVKKFPQAYRRWKDTPESMVFPGGEGLGAVRRRVEPALMQLSGRHPEDNIALVSHRVPIKVLLCAALGLSDAAFWKIQVDTASVSAFNYTKGVFSLLFANETCHLKSLGDKLGARDF